MEVTNVFSEPMYSNENGESDEDSLEEEEDLLNLNISESAARMNYLQSSKHNEFRTFINLFFMHVIIAIQFIHVLKHFHYFKMWPVINV